MTEPNPNAAAVEAAARAAGFRDPVAAAALIPARFSATDSDRATALASLASQAPEMLNTAARVAGATTPDAVREAVASAHDDSPAGAEARALLAEIQNR